MRGSAGGFNKWRGNYPRQALRLKSGQTPSTGQAFPVGVQGSRQSHQAPSWTAGMRIRAGGSQAGMWSRASSSSFVFTHSLCDGQTPLRLDQLGAVDLVPPTTGRRPRDNLPALGNLQFQGRNAAPYRGGKVDDVAHGSHPGSDNAATLVAIIISGQLHFPFGHSAVLPIVVGRAEESCSSPTPSAGELRTTAVRVSANAPRISFPPGTPGGPCGLGAASCRQ